MSCFHYLLLNLKRTVLLTGTAGIVVGLSSCQNDDYKKHEGDEARLVVAILNDNGCLECHSQQAQLPFYGKFPVIGATVKADIRDATRYVDFTFLVEALEKGKPVSEADLAKLEHTALSGSMPPFKYYALPMHWGKSLNSDEKKVILSWAKEVRKERFATPSVAAEFINEPLQPLMESLPTDPAKVALGFSLFHDTRLSADNTVACATCHGLETGGVDRLQYSEGIGGQFGGVNAPTVYNSALNFIQFWDGRAADLQEQASGPPLNMVEMGHLSFDDICNTLAEDEEFSKKFMEVYPEGFTEANITETIAEFEKTLLTPSRFDKYLMGDKNALTAYELEGYQLFKDNKCATCHVGVNIGGQSFEYMGIKNDYFHHRGLDITDGDHGRYAVTQDDYDMHRFKTPTLRNVMITYPYMHDGTLVNIEDAIRIMHEFQIGQKISDKDTDKIVAFLHTLTGEYNGKILQ